MQNGYMYITIIGTLLGVIIVGIAFWRFKKLEKEHKKTSNDDYLSDSEKIVQNKSIKILYYSILNDRLKNIFQRRIGYGN